MLAAMDLRKGQAIDRYVVDGLIGTGGMALVYRVRHTRLGSQHAVKVLRLPTPSVVDRLLREGRAQSSLQHPNVVPVTDVIEVNGCPGLVMPWVDGPSLSRLLRAHRFSLSELAALAEGLFAGIGAAHAAGWVHRDLKAGNVMMQRLGAELLPRITDFGLVKALVGPIPGGPTPGGPAPDGPTTRTGAMLGTPAYMAPEQFADAGRVDHRSDVYALGVILYEACTGRRPYEGSEPLALLEQARSADLPAVHALRSDLPAGLQEVLRGALHPLAAQRTPDVETLAAQWHALEWPAPAWRPETLDLAASVTPQPALGEAATRAESTTVSDPFGATFPSVTEASEAFESSEGAVSVGSETMAPPPSSARGRPWAVAAGLVAALVLAVGAFRFAPTGAPTPAPAPDAVRAPLTVPTLDAVPRVTPDDALQRQLDRGWRALLDGDLKEAERRLTAVTEALPDQALPPLMLGYVLMRRRQVPRSLALSERTARAHPTDHEPGSALARAVGAQQRTSSIDPPEMVAYREAHPEDLLALLMAADFCAQAGTEACEADLPKLLEAAPDAVITYRVVAESWRELHRPQQARAVLAQGLTLTPDDPELLQQQAYIELQAEELAAARATLGQLARLEPSSLPVKKLRLQLAVMERDEELVEGLRAELTSPSQEMRVRLSFFDTASQALVGMGRTHEAEALWLEALELVQGNPQDMLWVLLRVHSVAVARTDREATARYLEQAGVLAATSPEVRSVERDRLAASVLMNRAVDAADAGDLDEARRLQERLDQSDGVSTLISELVGRAVAAAEGDADRILTLDKSLWQGECVRAVVIGDSLRKAGAASLAAETVRPVVDRCPVMGSERAHAALGYVLLAEGSANADEVRRAVERAAHLWADADADHPVTVRLRALREAHGVPLPR